MGKVFEKMMFRQATRACARFSRQSFNFATITKFSKEHEWVVYDDSTKIATVGITDFAQSELGDIVFVEAPELEDDIVKMDTVGALESVKGVADLYTPVSGEVSEVNEAVIDDPGMLNQEADSAWIFKLTMSQPEELDELMDKEAYDAFVEECKSN